VEEALPAAVREALRGGKECGEACDSGSAEIGGIVASGCGPAEKSMSRYAMPR